MEWFLRLLSSYLCNVLHGFCIPCHFINALPHFIFRFINNSIYKTRLSHLLHQKRKFMIRHVTYIQRLSLNPLASGINYLGHKRNQFRWILTSSNCIKCFSLSFFAPTLYAFTLKIITCHFPFWIICVDYLNVNVICIRGTLNADKSKYRDVPKYTEKYRLVWAPYDWAPFAVNISRVFPASGYSSKKTFQRNSIFYHM